MSESAKPDREKVDRIYVLVCKGDTCSQKGNVERLRVTLKQAARELPAQRVKIAYTSCLGMCGEGPNALVCAGGIALHRCTDKAAETILKEARGLLDGRTDP
jgi:NADH:ubiquinone oxidoreductase subunit E